MCNGRGVSLECIRNSGVGGGGRNGRQQASTNRAESVGCSSGPTGGTYILTDPGTGAVRRTGRTNDLDRRRNEHGRDAVTRELDFQVDRRTDSYSAQRGREQRIYDYHPETDLTHRRPISPNNPNRDSYLRDGDQL